MNPEGERLQKVLARAGFGSRRSCDELIASGRVSVNGGVAVLGRRVNPTLDSVEVDGVPVGILPGTVYYLVNKPAGVVTTSEDPQGRPTVVELVPDTPRVFSVGRLDLETEGLIILTNDGDLALRLTHPRYGVEKEYLVEVDGDPGRAALRQLRSGVDIGDETKTVPAKVTPLSPGLLRIAVHEGRNHQVRRMCEAVGHPVRRLVRTRIGPINDNRLAPGTWRSLSADEVRSLEIAASGQRTPPGTTSSVS